MSSGTADSGASSDRDAQSVGHDDDSESDDSLVATQTERDIYAQIKQKVGNLPREEFAIQLQTLLGGDNASLKEIRKSLYDLAKQTVPNTPQGDLIRRKNAGLSKAKDKLADDIYMLYEYIEGDNKVLLIKLFKNKSRKSIAASQRYGSDSETDPAATGADLATLVKDTLKRMRQEKDDMDELVKSLSDENEKLRKDMSDIKTDLVNCQKEIDILKSRGTNHEIPANIENDLKNLHEDYTNAVDDLNRLKSTVHAKMGNVEKRLKTTEKTVEITVADKIDKLLKDFRYEMDYNSGRLQSIISLLNASDKIGDVTMRDPWPLPTAPSRQGTVAGSTDSRGNRSEGHPSVIGQAAATPVRGSETQAARPNEQPPTNSRVEQDSDNESPTNAPDVNRARTPHVEDKSSSDLNVAHMQSVDIEWRHRDDNHHGPEGSSTSSKSVSRPSELPRTNNSQSAPIQPQPPATQDEDSDSLEGFKTSTENQRQPHCSSVE